MKHEISNETLKYLDLAVKLEKDSLKFYTTARNRISDFNMKSLLNALLGNEISHLASVVHVRKLYSEGKITQARGEAEKFRVHRPKNPFRDMKQVEKLSKHPAGIHDVFKKAVELETKANEFYTEAAMHAEGSFIKAYLRKLAKEELIHKTFIESHKEALYDSGYWLGIEHVRLET